MTRPSKRIASGHAELVRRWWGLAGTGLGIGLFPLAPGTIASAATLPLGWLIVTTGGIWGLIAASGLVFLVGIVASQRIVSHTKVDDASVIVIDEIAGQLLTLAAAPVSLTGYAVAFLAFRLFDILKPWPASWADRELEGGWGVMTDDMIAGAYAALLLWGAGSIGWM